MKPSFLPGDAVTVVPVHMTGSVRVPALVISVQHAKQVPDAEARGLLNQQPYNYWVMSYGDTPWGIKFWGPFRGWELKSQWEASSAA